MSEAVGLDKHVGKLCKILPRLPETHAPLSAALGSLAIPPWGCSETPLCPEDLRLPPVPSPRVKSPPWIMKSLITRWNLLSL